MRNSAPVTPQPERVAALAAVTLVRGVNPQRQTMCAMEAVAWVAGEPWSDSPASTCPVLGSFIRHWDDALDSHARQRLLKPLITRLVGTRSNAAVEQRRAWLAWDWLVRAFAPGWLDTWPQLSAHAQSLRSLDPIDAPELANRAAPTVLAAAEAAQGAAAGLAERVAARVVQSMPPISAEQVASWPLAREVAWQAACGSGGNAAAVAARVVFEAPAADAAWDAALLACWRLAWESAWAAAVSRRVEVSGPGAAWESRLEEGQAAARAALVPATANLQTSVLTLLDRMLAVAGG